MSTKSLTIIAALLLLLGQAFAQPQRAGLLRQLTTTKPDTVRLRILYALGDSYLSGTHQDKPADLQQAKTYFLTAYHLADSLKITSAYSKYECQCKVAEVFAARGQLAKSDALFMQAAKFYHDHNLPAIEADTYERCVTNTWLISNDFEHIRMLMLKALGIYQKLKEPSQIVYTNYWIALIDLHRDPSNYYALTTARCRQTIAKYEHTKAQNVDYVYSLLSRVNRYMGNLNQSLSYSLKAMERMKATDNVAAEETVYAELAQTYQDLGQTENSIIFYKKTIELREKKNLPQEYLFRTAGFVAQGLIKLNRAAEALRYIEALEKRHKPDSKEKYAFVAQVKAYCYEALKDYKRAEDAYLDMIGNFKDDNELRAKAEYDVANFYVHRKEFAKAALYLHDKSEPPNFTIAKDLEYLYFQVDSARGNFPSAIDHFRQYKIMTDSIFNVAKIKQIQELQIRYETGQKEKDIKLLKSESVIQQNNVQRANTQRNLTLAGIAILTLTIVAFYKSYRANQEKNIVLNRLIADKDSILLEKDNLLAEKEWLLKEIHHRVKNNLQIVMGLLQRQSAYIDSEAALAAIKNSENRMHSIALIHQKLYQSDSLNHVYMPDYIDDFLNHLKDTGDLGNRILFEKQLDGVSLHVSQAVPLGLILNEAVTNAIKYAYAVDEQGIIHVSLYEENPDEYTLIIRDNGKGLGDGFTIEQADTMGMNLMRGLSKQLGGVFKVENDGGVTINVRFKVV